MEYNPRYPQPFSLSQAIALDPAVAWDGLALEITSSHLLLTVLTEIARLRNSLLHLRRSQNELQEYLRELASKEGDLEVSQAVRENEITMHVSLGLTLSSSAEGIQSITGRAYLHAQASTDPSWSFRCLRADI